MHLGTNIKVYENQFVFETAWWTIRNMNVDLVFISYNIIKLPKLKHFVCQLDMIKWLFILEVSYIL